MLQCFIEDLEDVPRQIIIGMKWCNPEVLNPYRLDLETGELTFFLPKILPQKFDFWGSNEGYAEKNAYFYTR